MRTRVLKAAFVAVGVAVGFFGCGEIDSADRAQAREMERLTAEMERAVGPPAISNFEERRQAKRILELRDSALATHAYIVTLTGEVLHLCESVGYGIPASVQYTNPEKIAQWYKGGNYVLMPQADPNGLFMPPGLSATYVMCADPNGGEPRAVYVEQELLVSPFKLKAARSLSD